MFAVVFPALVVALVVLLLVVACVRGPEVTLLVGGDALRIHLSPVDKVVCGRGDLVVPLSQVRSVVAARSGIACGIWVFADDEGSP